MKKLLTILLVAIMAICAVSLTACGKKDKQSGGNGSESVIDSGSENNSSGNDQTSDVSSDNSSDQSGDSAGNGGNTDTDEKTELSADEISAIISDAENYLNFTAVYTHSGIGEAGVRRSVKVDASEEEGFVKAQITESGIDESDAAEYYLELVKDTLYRIRYSSDREEYVASLYDGETYVDILYSISLKLNSIDEFTYDKTADEYRFEKSGGEGYIKIENGKIAAYHFESNGIEDDVTFSAYGTTEVDIPDYKIIYGEISVMKVLKKFPTSATLNIIYYDYDDGSISDSIIMYFDDADFDYDNMELKYVEAQTETDEGAIYFKISGGRQLVISQNNGAWIAYESDRPLLRVLGEYLSASDIIDQSEQCRFYTYKDDDGEYVYEFSLNNDQIWVGVKIKDGFVSEFTYKNKAEKTDIKYVYTDVNETDVELPDYTLV